MKSGIHPRYVPVTITCACGNVIETRSTKPNITVEICSNCHPFFTGKQKIVDSAGRVERFTAKYKSVRPVEKKPVPAPAPARPAPPKTPPVVPIAVPKPPERGQRRGPRPAGRAGGPGGPGGTPKAGEARGRGSGAEGGEGAPARGAARGGGPGKDQGARREGVKADAAPKA